MTHYYDILRKAYKMYTERFNYAYFYGAKGERLTEKVMNQLIEAYPQYYGRFSVQALEEIKRYSKNKIGLDCSGFLTKLTGLSGNSAMLFAMTTDKTTVEQGKCGYMLWKQGHCGIDIGFGYCMHIGSSGDTLEIAKIQKVGFTKSGAFPDVDYTGSNSN